MKQITIAEIIEKMQNDTMSVNKIISRNFNFEEHFALIKTIAGNNYDFDADNLPVFALLLHYFNGSPYFESIFPDNDFSLKKGIALIGSVGTGKSMIMRIFMEYCQKTFLYHRIFKITEARYVGRHFMNEGNIDRFTLNRADAKDYKAKMNPMNYCFDELGVEQMNLMYYGSEFSPISELLLDRYNVFTVYKKNTHITSNLSPEALSKRYGERIGSRMREMFNVISVLGKDRRK